MMYILTEWRQLKPYLKEVNEIGFSKEPILRDCLGNPIIFNSAKKEIGKMVWNLEAGEAKFQKKEMRNDLANS